MFDLEVIDDPATAMVARYHDGSAPSGRAHRLVVVAHPLPGKTLK
jgi:hypothetical protein